MRSLLFLTLALAGLAAGSTVLAADVTRIELHQREEVMQQQQRFVGNLRAQAQREGIVVKVPQLFVYFTDQSPAWHLQGFRRGFERTLGLTYEHGRRERSMVNLERLLDRTITPGGQAYTHEDLPEVDLYLLLYRREGCDDCEQVASSLDAWLDGQENLEALWFDIWVDRHEAD